MPIWISAPQLEPQPIGQRSSSYINNPSQVNRQLRQMQAIDFSSSNSLNNRSRKRNYDEMQQETPDNSMLDRQDSICDEEDNDPNDSVRLWEEGWRERYYKIKFNVNKSDLEEFRIQVAQSYARGLCWVLQYYYQGVPAWDWYVFNIDIYLYLIVVYYLNYNLLGIFLIIMHHLHQIFCYLRIYQYFSIEIQNHLSH